MYPLNMTRAALGTTPAGFAVANDADEHKALTALAFSPAYAVPEPAVDEHATLLAEAEAKGIKVDKRWSASRLAAEIAKA